MQSGYILHCGSNGKGRHFKGGLSRSIAGQHVSFQRRMKK